MKYPLGILLIILGMVWSVISLLIDFTSGQWWTLFPLIGVLLAGWLLYRGLKFLYSHRNSIDTLENVLENISYLLQKQNTQRIEQIQNMLTALTMNPDEFQKQY